MWEFFIKNDRFSYLLIVALVGIGLFSVISIPKESAPEVVIPVGIVSVVYPGAPAADVESLVTNEIERGLSSLENVKEITSSSREGISNVTVEFEADADLDDSIQDLKDEIDIIATSLPSEANDPNVSEVNFVDQPIMTIALSADVTDFEFTELSTDVENAIESVSGVSRVEMSGVRDREVTVIVDQASLARYGVSISDVTNAIRNANQTFPIGQIINNGTAYNIAFEGDITDSTQIKNIGIISLGGQPVYVRDVAVVEDGLATARTLSRLSVSGSPSQNSISLNVYKQSGGDITQIASAVNARVDELTQPGELLDGITTKTVLDSGEDIKSDLVQLSTSGLQTVLLVVIMLIVAIGWREGLLAGAAIPLSFLFGFIGLYFSGNTINFLSLFSLILGIGILVDSAIVMVEGINRKMKDNPEIDKQEAAIQTINEFSSPLLAGTLTTVSMFTGLFIVSGIIGQFIASIPFTLIFLLFASAFVSLAILPLLASAFLKRRSATKMERRQYEYTMGLETWYRTKLTPYLDDVKKQNHFLSLIFAGLVFAISLPINMFGGLVAAPLVYVVSNKFMHWNPKGFFLNVAKFFSKWISLIVVIGICFAVMNTIFPTYNPVRVIFFEQTDADFIILEVENPEGTTKEVTDIDVRRVEEVLYTKDYIESFTVTVGSGSQFGSGGTGEKFANVFVNLTDDRDVSSMEIIESLRSDFADFTDTKVTVDQPSDGPPTGAAVVVKFLGDDLNEITTLANQSAQLLRNTENVVNVETSTNNNSTEFVLELDRAKAASLGLSPFSVSQVARSAVFGSDATSLTTLNDDIDVVVKMNINNSPSVNADNANVTSINAVEQILIPTQSGSVALSSLVSTYLRESSSVINHEGGKRVVSVTAGVTAQGSALEIQAAVIEQIRAELDVPDDVEISTGGGEAEDSNQAFMEMGLALVVGIVLMIAVLALQFNSFLHTRYVLSILPYSLIGIMVGLAITQNPLSFPSMMGFIALSGIVVNNSILLIDQMNATRKLHPDRNVRDVVLDASGSRLRPILLTTLTTVIGMVPLTYAGDLWAPLAYAVMFGLVFSVIITLVLIPIVYLRNPGAVNR
jgi:HAE1 family hydrophobic/amphiphilic exporter-1